MSASENDIPQAALARRLVRLLLAPRSMIFIDLAVIVLGGAAMVYAVLRFLNILGEQFFIQDCDFTLDVFDGIADIFVFYGVALESRAHLLRTMFPDQSGARASDEKLDGVSEYTGLILVVLGLLMELTTQFGLLAADLQMHHRIVFPLCLAGFVIVGITLQQLVMHLILVGRSERKTS